MITAWRLIGVVVFCFLLAAFLSVGDNGKTP